MIFTKAIGVNRVSRVRIFNKQFYSHDIIGINFKKILQKSGVEVRKLYNLRHTFASQMISKGADIVWVSKMLGHKDVSITLKIYTKFIQEDDDMRFKKIENMGTILSTIEDISFKSTINREL